MEDKMKKIIITALVTFAIAATALIAVPALAKDSTAKTQTAVQTAGIAIQTAPSLLHTAPVVAQPALSTDTSSLYMGYGSAFCSGELALGDTVTLQRVAATLGITYDQLVKELQNGETIADIATAQNVGLSKVVDTIVAAQTDMVNVLVKYGYVTQDQANTIIANLRTRVETSLSTTTPSANSGYGYSCYALAGSSTVPGTSYGYGMMGGGVGGMMGW